MQTIEPQDIQPRRASVRGTLAQIFGVAETSYPISQGHQLALAVVAATISWLPVFLLLSWLAKA